MFDELIKRLRVTCGSCKLWDGYKCCLKGECSAQTRLQAADAIEELGKPKWIPVTERLPSWGEDVLISISGFANVGHLVQTNDEKQYNWFYSGWYHDPCEVTHWMPLPEPPKEET